MAAEGSSRAATCVHPPAASSTEMYPPAASSSGLRDSPLEIDLIGISGLEPGRSNEVRYQHSIDFISPSVGFDRTQPLFPIASVATSAARFRAMCVSRPARR